MFTIHQVRTGQITYLPKGTVYTCRPYQVWSQGGGPAGDSRNLIMVRRGQEGGNIIKTWPPGDWDKFGNSQTLLTHHVRKHWSACNSSPHPTFDLF